MKIKCNICSKMLKNKRCLAVHISKNHKSITNKEYYDKFFKKENEGICPVCKKPTTYNGIIRGYSTYHRWCFQKTDKFKKAVSNAQTGKKTSIKTRHKLSNSIKERWDDPNSIYNTDKYRKKHKKITKERWDDPNSIYNTDEYRKNISIGLTGEKNGMYGKQMSLETRKQMSNSHRPDISIYRKKFPLFCKVENIRENKNKDEYIRIQVKCKSCKQWFTPDNGSLHSRIYALEKENGNDGLYLYCSDNCKNKCPLYRLNPKHSISSNSYERSYNITFVKEVLKRQKDELGYNECEICGLRKHLQIHHEKPQKTHPHLSLDPDNGIILCGYLGNSCHLKFGHKDECNTGKLAHLKCDKIINLREL